MLFSGFRGLFACPEGKAGYSRRTSAHICSYGVHKQRVLEDSYTPDKKFPIFFRNNIMVFPYRFRVSTSLYYRWLRIRDERTAAAEKSISF